MWPLVAPEAPKTLFCLKPEESSPLNTSRRLPDCISKVFVLKSTNSKSLYGFNHQILWQKTKNIYVFLS